MFGSMSRSSRSGEHPFALITDVQVQPFLTDNRRFKPVTLVGRLPISSDRTAIGTESNRQSGRETIIAVDRRVQIRITFHLNALEGRSSLLGVVYNSQRSGIRIVHSFLKKRMSGISPTQLLQVIVQKKRMVGENDVCSLFQQPAITVLRMIYRPFIIVSGIESTPQRIVPYSETSFLNLGYTLQDLIVFLLERDTDNRCFDMFHIIIQLFVIPFSLA